MNHTLLEACIFELHIAQKHLQECSKEPADIPVQETDDEDEACMNHDELFELSNLSVHFDIYIFIHTFSAVHIVCLFSFIFYSLFILD